jgi:hypothetical protein
MTRVPSVPLITCDPYFSLWSPADRLYDADTVHWTGRKRRVSGVALVDGLPYRFMGFGDERTLTQTDLEITATASRYRFEGAGVGLELTFLTPLLLDDLERFARPVSYIALAAQTLDGQARRIEVRIDFDDSFCKMSEEALPFTGGVHRLKNGTAAWMGQKKQAPLSHSGDDLGIDWGYLYLAAPDAGGAKTLVTREGAGGERLLAVTTFEGCQARAETFIAAAYDDIASINYFGDIRRGYWARDGKTILTAIEEAVAEYPALKTRCGVFDALLNAKALASGGAAYQKILSLAYRQAVAAHKLIADEKGEPVFVSKECFSNGCAATVDISYPSAPLFLLFNPELVKAMLRPILRFAALPVWTYDFAPHDAGRYPWVTGQVYGLNEERARNGETFPPFYAFPANAGLYNPRYQMPVEECGNMLVMLAAAAKAEGSAEFSRPHRALLEKWAAYLQRYGGSPGEQLCTDDFAGHLAANCNLAAKAIAGLEGYGILLGMWGDAAGAAAYHQKARAMAGEWLKNADRGDHTALVFDKDEGWSLKYNLVWDRLFGARLFDEAFYEREVDWYIKMRNACGVPLDSRRDYTKSDWILWTAAFTGDRQKREALIGPVNTFLEETDDRVPFSDWYDTKTAKHYHFQNRSVQGGLFMPLLADEWKA